MSFYRGGGCDAPILFSGFKFSCTWDLRNHAPLLNSMRAKARARTDPTASISIHGESIGFCHKAEPLKNI